MATLDDLAVGIAPVEPDPLAAFRDAFVADFGTIDGGDFTMDGSLPSWRSTFDDRPVTIRGQTAPTGTREYVVNGSRMSLPGDFFTLSLEDRQALLLGAVRRYV